MHYIISLLSVIGTFYAMAIVGPAIGYVLGGELLELFCDIGSVDLEK